MKKQVDGAEQWGCLLRPDIPPALARIHAAAGVCDTLTHEAQFIYPARIGLGQVGPTPPPRRRASRNEIFPALSASLGQVILSNITLIHAWTRRLDHQPEPENDYLSRWKVITRRAARRLFCVDGVIITTGSFLSSLCSGGVIRLFFFTLEFHLKWLFVPRQV